jgi:hypothetical protein
MWGPILKVNHSLFGTRSTLQENHSFVHRSLEGVASATKTPLNDLGACMKLSFFYFI